MSFDKIAAIYVYCMDYHGGQWSREYRLLSRISSQYKLVLSDLAIQSIHDPANGSSDWECAAQIYSQLVANNT